MSKGQDETNSCTTKSRYKYAGAASESHRLDQCGRTDPTQRHDTLRVLVSKHAGRLACRRRCEPRGPGDDGVERSRRHMELGLSLTPTAPPAPIRTKHVDSGGCEASVLALDALWTAQPGSCSIPRCHPAALAGPGRGRQHRASQQRGALASIPRALHAPLCTLDFVHLFQKASPPSPPLALPRPPNRKRQPREPPDRVGSKLTS
jgi:hypothetical protein